MEISGIDIVFCILAAGLALSWVIRAWRGKE